MELLYHGMIILPVEEQLAVPTVTPLMAIVPAKQPFWQPLFIFTAFGKY